jgi:hypothetical protein
LTDTNARPGTSAAGSRVFDIQVHDQTLLRFDIIAAAGATLTAVYRDFSVTVPGPLLNVSFRDVADNPVINGGRGAAVISTLDARGLGQALK